MSILPLKSSKEIGKRILPTTGERTIQLKKIEAELSFSEDNIDAIIASWEALNSAHSLLKGAQTLEPQRKRHTGGAYGHLSRNLATCLQGSPRVFARREFFYSDIDKAW